MTAGRDARAGKRVGRILSRSLAAELRREPAPELVEGESTVPTLIDPEELPFTREEIYEAGLRFLPTETAHLMADHLAHLGPHALAMRDARRETWRKAGIPNAHTMLLHYWVYPPELLAALAELSPDVAARVKDLTGRLARGHSDRAG